ncbi:MerR family transcriptional regulator [Companilactobacillus allii]|uniref:HTH merR-type domain-containing protein n=1 Tax=Companilactobacillus allii TaxID=1847728 RepID=A0A1P8Q1J8_9LACO|nr:MerR family transcriptional regulator [Companilactobacillus allii]APX71753.1 hypothetical protein BTM29_03915 [Companilactobacillus allii]USQ68840.1 MerR family transcriptional regulator [Companilactobacillus allii]
MLTITKFAQLANTTRRTLIYYDNKGIFHPIEIDKNGYRLYNYDQLYEITYILSLRKLGLSIKDIDFIINEHTDDDLNSKLNSILINIQNNIDHLENVKKILTTRFSTIPDTFSQQLHTPAIITNTKQNFWRSKQSVTCTEKEIAEIYSDFYKKLDSLSLTNKQDAGFMTQLADSNAALYPDASFCIIKSIVDTKDNIFPICTKESGEYISVITENTGSDICLGLKELKEYIDKNNLKISSTLWQMNLDEKFINKGSSKYVRLEYKLIN